MIKTYMVTSGRKEIKDEELEIINVKAENNLTTSFKSRTENFLLNVEERVVSLLKTKFKEFSYKILCVANEERNKNLNVLKLIILLDEKEKIDFVKNSLTEFEAEFGILREKPNAMVLSPIKEKVQEWADEIQNYLANEFKFNGKTIIEASSYNGELQSFNITNSGKGVNDNIVWVMKEISKAITLSKNIGLYIYDKYSFIDGYFKR